MKKGDSIIVLSEENGARLQGRYYLVKFYNYEVERIMIFNGIGFECFESEGIIHDEIEIYRLIEL